MSKGSKTFLTGLILFLLSFSIIVPNVVSLNTSSEINEIISSDETWKDQDLTKNETIVIASDVNLTIINSHIKFSNFTNNGFEVSGGILQIIDSEVEFGDNCISGLTNGTVILQNTTINNCVTSGISLSGAYSLVISDSLIQTTGSHGLNLDSLSSVSVTDSKITDAGDFGIQSIDVTSLVVERVTILNPFDRGARAEGSGDATFRDIVVTNPGGDAIRSDVSGTLEMENIEVTSGFGDGLQIENSQNALLRNIYINDVADDGLKIQNVGSISVTNATVSIVGGDGVDIEYASTANFEELHLSGVTDTGFESDFIENLSLIQTTITNVGVEGIAVVQSSQVTITESTIEECTDVGILLIDTITFDMDHSIVRNNLAGVLAINVSSADIHYSSIMGNTNYAINATNLGDGRIFDAANNYWGTLDKSAIVIYGSVSIDPILDENMNELGQSSDTTSSPFYFIMHFSIFLVSLPLIRKLK